MAFSDRFPHLSTRRPREKPVTAGTPFFSISVGRVSGRLSTPRAEQDADTDMEDALYDGRSAAVLRYLNVGVPVDYVTPEKRNPALRRGEAGKRKFVEALLDRGANVNARSRGGCTPLWVATQFARNDIAELLLDRGACVDAANDGGRTALMSAGMRGNQPLVELLLERGANPQLTVGNDKTAVSYAREEGHSEIAALLQKRAWNHTSRH